MDLIVKEMKENFVIDTSARMAFFHAEPGAERFRDLCTRAALLQCSLSISIVSLIEIFYISVQRSSESVAHERINAISELPLSVETLSENDIEAVGTMKALYKLSFADACIAGLAKRLDAILLHKDPEFEQLKESIVLESLPYKTAREKAK